MKTESLLQGAYDIHVHCTPDVIPRAQDLIELAEAASQAGLAGIVLKDHTTSTVGRAYALNRMVPQGPRFFSAVALNPPVGSLNPVAVESALREGAAIVYFPTYGSAHHIAVWGAGKPPTAFPLPGEDYRGVSILDKTGNPEPEVEAIVKLIAEYDAVLATGHLSPEESLALLRLAQKRGVRRMVVTHASESVTAMTPNQQLEAVAAGALIEHCFFAVTDSCPSAIAMEEIRDQIRHVGVENVIVSSDFGQVDNPPPVAGFVRYIERLRGLAFSDEEIQVLITDNPRKLLELCLGGINVRSNREPVPCSLRRHLSCGRCTGNTSPRRPREKAKQKASRKDYQRAERAATDALRV